ncbi:MAG: hypothetical protein A3J46_04630 [Candidatus Yanofskybacteria bacterium RIFCSPHIGHO2_02_FULL_41_11]|uniref:EamA domain-containing protein n=1 Tax=Candidatus Yanofskybacteria bacterium RIFCSPHIGHO2_02_FULL_41_11 TaxID=1802675 RepID=A0A1F8F7Y3_9BACT|nr:MAG: hypothetical protein A3J46_04630 [Candidatus Yanofskybacteria bacterium RIFCSPHIGHO2_02_FULL_41_11]
MSPAVRLILLAVIFTGIGTPFLKISQRLGVNASEILLVNSFASALIGFLGFRFIDYQSTGFGGFGLFVAFGTLLILNVGFLLTNYSLSLDGGLLSVIYAITPAATTLTILIGLIFLKEAQQIIVLRLLLGASFILLGSYLVSTSLK